MTNHHDDDYSHFVTPTPARAPENRMGIDAATGHFKIMAPGEDDGLEFIKLMTQLRDRYPLDPADIVLPEGWTIDAQGCASRTIVVDGEVKAVLRTHIHTEAP